MFFSSFNPSSCKKLDSFNDWSCPHHRKWQAHKFKLLLIRVQKMAKAGKEESSNIQVAIRVRPLIDKELRIGENSIVRVEDNLLVE